MVLLSPGENGVDEFDEKVLGLIMEISVAYIKMQIMME